MNGNRSTRTHANSYARKPVRQLVNSCANQLVHTQTRTPTNSYTRKLVHTQSRTQTNSYAGVFITGHCIKLKVILTFWKIFSFCAADYCKAGHDCKNDAVCAELLSDPRGYSCECVDGYTGENCETGKDKNGPPDY